MRDGDACKTRGGAEGGRKRVRSGAWMQSEARVRWRRGQRTRHRPPRRGRSARELGARTRNEISTTVEGECGRVGQPSMRGWVLTGTVRMRLKRAKVREEEKRAEGAAESERGALTRQLLLLAAQETRRACASFALRWPLAQPRHTTLAETAWPRTRLSASRSQRRVVSPELGRRCWLGRPR